MRVGARADAPPVVTPPIPEVVPACLLRRPRPVADLVPLQPGGAQQIVGELVLVGQIVVVRLVDLTSADPARAASLVPGSTVRPYADRWSGSQASAARTETSQSVRDSPGVP